MRITGEAGNCADQLPNGDGSNNGEAEAPVAVAPSYAKEVTRTIVRWGSYNGSASKQ